MTIRTLPCWLWIRACVSAAGASSSAHPLVTVSTCGLASIPVALPPAHAEPIGCLERTYEGATGSEVSG